MLRYNRGGFARYEWHKHPMDPNEALDLRCYARAALEYLKVRLEQIPRDVIAHFNSQNIEKVEVGLGREILVEKPRTKSRDISSARSNEHRAPPRHWPAWNGHQSLPFNGQARPASLLRGPAFDMSRSVQSSCRSPKRSKFVSVIFLWK